METKVCIGCGLDLPTSDFYRHPKTKDGFRPRCKRCIADQTRQWRATHPEAYEAQLRRGAKKQAEKFAEDPALRRSRKRSWAEKNQEHLRRYARQMYWSDVEVAREKRRQWRDNNLEKAKEAARRAYLRNPDRVKVRAKERHLQLKNLLTPEGNKWALVLENDPCSYCGRPSTGVDHIDPIIKGGGHVPDNLAGACRSCNSSKRDRSLLEFLSRGGLKWLN